MAFVNAKKQLARVFIHDAYPSNWRPRRWRKAANKQDGGESPRRRRNRTQQVRALSWVINTKRHPKGVRETISRLRLSALTVVEAQQIVFVCDFAGF